MRTTIDLPDDLLRQAKAQAAMQGLKLKDYFRSAVELAVRQSSALQKQERFGRDTPIPVVIPAAGRIFPALVSNEELFQVLDEYDRGAK